MAEKKRRSHEKKWMEGNKTQKKGQNPVLGCYIDHMPNGEMEK